jgi:MoaA/NifB/PqqE/SkfB family radical SAM enzyme
MSKIYCSLAFNSVSFGPHGGSRPCCAVDTFFWRESKHILPDYNNKLEPWFNNSDLVKLRKDLLSGKWNPICNLCKTREDHNQPSTRTIFNDMLANVEKETGKSWRVDQSEITDFSKIFLLDVTVGNKCNSACVMCNESNSSLWAKEQEEITGVKFDHNPNWFDAKHVPELVDKLINLRAVQFIGGEPTINDDHIVLLKRLIDSGRSKDITLNYVTNLTGISEELLELWRHFSTKYITMSIDGVGKVNEYIRYPFSWEKVTRQIEKLKTIADREGNYHLGLSHTVTSLNLLTFGDMIKWWEEQVASSSYVANWLPHIQCVNNPEYFDPSYAPLEMKNAANLMLEELEDYLTVNGLNHKYFPAIENIKTNVIKKTVDENKQLKMWLKMQDFLITLDEYRNRKIFDYLPYMKNYWIMS